MAALVRSLGTERATFFGSSSGGTTILSVIADHPELVRHAVIHEPAVMADTPLFRFIFPKMIAVRAFFGGGFEEDEWNSMMGEGESMMILDKAVYRTLGEDHMRRRAKNKKVWYNRYADPDIPCCSRAFAADELQRAPLTITLGESTLDVFASGIRNLAERAGTEGLLVPAKHFAYVTIPEQMAKSVYRAEEAISK